MAIANDILEAARQAARGELQAVAEQYNVNYNTLRRELAAYRRDVEAWRAASAGLADEQRQAERVVAPAPQPITIVTPPLTVTASKWLYAADFHSPLHDERWLERLVRVGLAHDVETLVVGGDLYDLDTMSRHPADLPQVPLSDAIRVNGEVTRYLARYFARLVLVPGNHDRRFARAVNKNLSFGDVVRMMAGDATNITTTDNDYVYVETGGDVRWCVGHPRFFATYPTKGLDEVALKRSTHVIGAHSHTLGAVRVNDRFWAVSPGMMARNDLTPYIVRGNGLSKYAEQSHGFVLVEHHDGDGDVLQLFAEGTVRWSRYAA